MRNPWSSSVVMTARDQGGSVKAFLDRPKSVLLRRALFQVHLWVGVAAALYVIVVSVTGAALVFRINLQRAAHPHLFTPSAAGPLAAPVSVLDAVRDAYPSGRVSGVDAPTTARPTHLAYVLTGDRLRTVLIDPVSADVLGELPERSVVRTLQDLHFDLLAWPGRLAARLHDRLDTSLEARHVGAARRGRRLDRGGRSDVGGDRYLLRVSERVPGGGQQDLTAHGQPDPDVGSGPGRRRASPDLG
jgi:hypothetical protein